MAKNLHDGLTDRQQKEEAIAPADIDTGKTLVMMTNALLGLGSAMVVGGVTWWALGGQGAEVDGSIGTALVPTPEGGAAIQVGGQF